MELEWHAPADIPERNRPILMTGSIGCVAPEDAYFVSGFYDAVWKPHNPWRTSTGSAIEDAYGHVVSWAYLPELGQLAASIRKQAEWRFVGGRCNWCGPEIHWLHHQEGAKHETFKACSGINRCDCRKKQPG